MNPTGRVLHFLFEFKKYFIGNVAQAIGARKFGSNSQYATFETKNGQIVTIRLADHNASTLKFDYAGKDNGISIVITPKDNLGVEKGGKAHVVEFFYDAIKLRRAEGKPLADIVRSIEQALYSGEYKDTTGLAEREEVNADDAIRYNRKEMFEGKKRYAERKALENREIGKEHGMTDEQADAIDSLCSFRHDFHVSMDSSVKDNTDVFKELIRIREELENAGLPRLDFGRFDEGDYIDIDDFNILGEIEKVPDINSKEYDDWYNNQYNRIYDDLSELHEILEKYLGDIDVRYGTSYKPTGLSRIYYQKVAPVFFRTPDGEAYGFTLNGKIYIDPRVATAETPVHEYHHLWAEALEKSNPDAWAHLKSELYKDADLVSWVKERYPDLAGDENGLAHELFAKFGGKRGTERLREEQAKAEAENKDGIVGKARIIAMFNRFKDMLSKYWQMARDLFAGNNTRLSDMSANDFADMAMADLMKEVKPRDDAATQTQHTETRFSLPSGEKGDNRRIVVADYARRGGLDDLAREISLNRGAKDERAVVMLSKTSPDERRLLKESISKESNGTLAELAERATAIENMPAMKIKAEPISMKDFEKNIHKNGDEATIKDDGMAVVFSNNSLGKLYNAVASETGAAKNLLSLISSAKYAYSQPHNNTGKSRDDGTKHPNRENTLEYRNYVNKFENENGTYYCRFIVMRSTDGINKSHGAVVSDVSISKENTTGNNSNGVKLGEAFHGSSPGSTWRASASMLKPDTKLQNFFNYAKKGIKISDENVYDIPLKEKGDADKSQTRFSLIGEKGLRHVDEVNENNRQAENLSVAEEDRKMSSAHDAMSHRGLREIVGEEGYDAFLDDVGRRLRDEVKGEVSSSVGREFLGDVLGVATNAQHTGRGRSYEERRRDTVGLTIGLLLERIW